MSSHLLTYGKYSIFMLVFLSLFSRISANNLCLLEQMIKICFLPNIQFVTFSVYKTC